jgi:small-conductance mechanosensitive channel
MSITTEEAEQMAEICDQLGGFAQCAAAIRSLAAERDALRARAVKWAGIAGTLMAERDQLIGVLQIAVEKSGDMETPPAWVNGACSLLNRGFLKVDPAAERDALQYEIEKLRAALQTARRDALKEAEQAVATSTQRSQAIAAICALKREGG